MFLFLYINSEDVVNGTEPISVLKWHLFTITLLISVYIKYGKLWALNNIVIYKQVSL